MSQKHDSAGADFRWEEPPQARSGLAGVSWAPIADILRQRPKEWAHVASRQTRKKADSTAAAIKQGRLASMPRGEFEAVARNGEDGTFHVYARYVGVS